MSIYPPPDRTTSIFNPADFLTTDTEVGVSAAYVDTFYLKKAGNQTVVGRETFQGGILTNTIGLASGTQLVVAATNRVDVTTTIADFSGDINAAGDIDANLAITAGSSITAPTMSAVTLTVTGSGSLNDTNFTGNITQDASKTTTLRTTTVNGTVTCSRIIDTGNLSVAGVSTLTGDVTASGNLGVTGTVTAANLAGTLTTAAQTNITSVGTLTSLTVSGTIAGTLTTAAQPNITSLGTLTSLSVTGTAAAGNVNTTGVYQVNGATFAKLYGTNSVAIGPNAGGSATPTSSIAIGNSAGSTTTNSNTIILNASGTALNSDGTSRFFVKPIRNNTTATSLLQYDATSGEITYGPTLLTVPQLVQTTPGYGSYYLDNSAIPHNTEDWMFQPSSTVGQSTGGTLQFQYTGTGVFTNNSGATRMYLVTYSGIWQGGSGGRRQMYIRTSNLAGNVPRGTSTGIDSTLNVALSYVVATDAASIKMSGTATIVLANTGTFSVYAYQTFGSDRTLSGRVTVLCL